jgi:hypothetical protein
MSSMIDLWFRRLATAAALGCAALLTVARRAGPSIFVGSITPETITGSYLNGDGRRITLTRQHEEEHGFPNC